jgi:hypothetical protein
MPVSRFRHGSEMHPIRCDTVPNSGQQRRAFAIFAHQWGGVDPTRCNLPYPGDVFNDMTNCELSYSSPNGASSIACPGPAVTLRAASTHPRRGLSCMFIIPTSVPTLAKRFHPWRNSLIWQGIVATCSLQSTPPLLCTMTTCDLYFDTGKLFHPPALFPKSLTERCVIAKRKYVQSKWRRRTKTPHFLRRYNTHLYFENNRVWRTSF